MAKQDFLTVVENQTFVATLKATKDFDVACASVPQVDAEWLRSQKAEILKAVGIPVKPAKPADDLR